MTLVSYFWWKTVYCSIFCVFFCTSVLNSSSRLWLHHGGCRSVCTVRLKSEETWQKKKNKNKQTLWVCVCSIVNTWFCCVWRGLTLSIESWSAPWSLSQLLSSESSNLSAVWLLWVSEDDSGTSAEKRPSRSF